MTLFVWTKAARRSQTSEFTCCRNVWPHGVLPPICRYNINQRSSRRSLEINKRSFDMLTRTHTIVCCVCIRSSVPLVRLKMYTTYPHDNLSQPRPARTGLPCDTPAAARPMRPSYHLGHEIPCAYFPLSPTFPDFRTIGRST